MQNAFDSQNHLSCIQHWEEARPSLSLSLPAGHMTELLGSHDNHVSNSQPAALEEAKEEEPCDKHVINTTGHLTKQEESGDTQTRPDPPKPLPLARCDQPTLGYQDALSPDSGAELSAVPPLEPFDVSSAREELATLVADKQRMEAQHKRLQRRLKAVRERELELHQVRPGGRVVGRNTRISMGILGKGGGGV